MDRSGWCLKLPLTEHNQGEHDGCPRHFETRSCACTCGHKGEKSLEQRETVFKPVVAPKTPRVDTSVY